MSRTISRRDLLTRGSTCLAAGLVGWDALAGGAETSAGLTAAEPFRYSLNMATIMGQKLNPAEEAEVAAKAGYSGIEPWVRNLRQYVEFAQRVAVGRIDLGSFLH